MIVMIKSGPETNDGEIGLALAKQSGADLMLLQNGVYYAQMERLGIFPGAVYVLDDDKRLRGIKDSEMDSRVKTVNYDTLTDIVTSGVKVVGMF